MGALLSMMNDDNGGEYNGVSGREKCVSATSTSLKHVLHRFLYDHYLGSAASCPRSITFFFVNVLFVSDPQLVFEMLSSLLQDVINPKLRASGRILRLIPSHSPLPQNVGGNAAREFSGGLQSSHEIISADLEPDPRGNDHAGREESRSVGIAQTNDTIGGSATVTVPAAHSTACSNEHFHICLVCAMAADGALAYEGEQHSAPLPRRECGSALSVDVFLDEESLEFRWFVKPGRVYDTVWNARETKRLEDFAVLMEKLGKYVRDDDLYWRECERLEAEWTEMAYENVRLVFDPGGPEKEPGVSRVLGDLHVRLLAKFSAEKFKFSSILMEIRNMLAHILAKNEDGPTRVRRGLAEYYESLQRRKVFEITTSATPDRSVDDYRVVLVVLLVKYLPLLPAFARKLEDAVCRAKEQRSDGI